MTTLIDDAVTEDALDRHAAALFASQRDRSPLYARYAGGDTIVTGWRTVPALPVAAFREPTLGPSADQAVAEFRTSGTTSAGARPGLHRFDAEGLARYRQGALWHFARTVLAGLTRATFVSLIPDARSSPDSSLSRMVTWVVEAYGSGRDVFDPTGESLERRDGPIVLLGTAFTLANVFETHPGLRLHPETRVMETGGFKGRRRELSRAALWSLYAAAGIAPENVIGEYGMTELSSQWYDAVAGLGGHDPEARVYAPPPWARSRVVAPSTLSDVAMGDTGLIWLYDALNVGSVQAVLTEDLGVRRPTARPGLDGFTFVGRASGATLRGCSLRFDGASHGAHA